MRYLVPAALIALSLTGNALAAPERTYELPAGSALERLQPTQPTPAPRKTPDLRDPWMAAGLTLAGPLLVSGLTYYGSAASGNGDLYSVAPPVMALGPLSLVGGHLYSGALARGGTTLLGGYVAEALGAVIAAPAIALTSGKEGEGAGFAFLSGLFIGPMVALGAYTVVAAVDAYQTAVRHNERELADLPAAP